MRTSEAIGQLAAALANAQGEFENPERNRTVRVATKPKDGKPAGSYTFDYATFDAILAQTRPILAKHGLAVVQAVSTSGRTVTVTTRLLHSSGEWLEESMSGEADSADLQAIGSATTYLKRYSYTGLLSIAAEEDDDGAAGSGHEAEKSERLPLPDCPKCGTNKSVIIGKPEYGGGYVCFGKKGGCGAKWQDPVAKANEVAAEHGLTTGDKVPPPAKGKKPEPEAKSMYEIALGMISRINAPERITVFKDWLLKNHSTMTAEELDDIDAKLAEAAKHFSETQAA